MNGLDLHHRLENNLGLLIFGILFVTSIGGLVQILPSIFQESLKTPSKNIHLYQPLELAGRDIYIREGCNTCHSQMIRPFRSETERYGEYSKSGEFVYDHPFLWGSKRTGPDLHRVGGKYPDSWHFHHMLEPTAISPGSIMPAYPWLYEQDVDRASTGAKIRAMQSLGVPYPEGYADQAEADMDEQAQGIVKSLEIDGFGSSPDKEIIALIAYLQRLGTDIKNTDDVQASNSK